MRACVCACVCVFDECGVDKPLCAVPLQCRCDAGFQLKRDGKTCVDVDECTTSYPCTQRCINTHGSFHCLCVDGFQLSPNDPHRLQVHLWYAGDRSSSLLGRWMVLVVFVMRCRTECNQVKCLIFVFLCAEEEPYLIFANRYYLRKLNLDGTNYTLIKQVPLELEGKTASTHISLVVKQVWSP